MTARFKGADKDHDGKLTLEEARAGMPLVVRYFSRIDVRNHGAVTLEDIAAFTTEQGIR